MDVSDMVETAKNLGAKREEFRDYIDLMMLWYRDVLIFKATKNINQLIFVLLSIPKFPHPQYITIKRLAELAVMESQLKLYCFTILLKIQTELNMIITSQKHLLTERNRVKNNIGK